MCEICEFKKDVELLQATTMIMGQIDFERIVALTDLFAKVITLIDSFGEDKPETFNCRVGEIEVDTSNVAALAMMDLHEVADAAAAFYDTYVARAERTATAIEELLRRVVLEEESEHTAPPSAFSDFFGGGDNE